MLKIEINREDYWNFNKFVLLQRYKVTVYSFIVGLPIMMVLIFLGMKLPFWYSVSVGIIGGVFINYFAYKRIKQRIKKLLEDNKGILGVHEIEITNEELKWRNSVTEGSTKWEGINSIEEDKDYFYIFIDKIMAHIIPKRTFTTQVDMNRFLDQIKTYLKTNK
ncbi:hypothetical protein J2T13_005389 [Paenibacillus sp. DS2015]|uniref:YcxB family protein n=1 Tax=Paenibacillus sp. DS2015 TaxID=3373917 RepID=UPI003D22EA85